MWAPGLTTKYLYVAPVLTQRHRQNNCMGSTNITGCGPAISGGVSSCSATKSGSILRVWGLLADCSVMKIGRWGGGMVWRGFSYSHRIPSSDLLGPREHCRLQRCVENQLVLLFRRHPDLQVRQHDIARSNAANSGHYWLPAAEPDSCHSLARTVLRHVLSLTGELGAEYREGIDPRLCST